MSFAPIPSSEVETVNTTLPGRQWQSGALGLDGGGWITWWVNLDATTSQHSHRAQIFDANGDMVGDELTLRVNTTDAFEIIQLESGRLLAINHNGGTGGSVTGRFLEPDGTGLSSIITLQSLNATTVASFTAAIPTGDGGFWMAGRLGNEVSLRTFDANGTFQAVTVISAINTAITPQPDFPGAAQIVALQDGGVAVAWAVASGALPTTPNLGLQVRKIASDGTMNETIHDIALPEGTSNPRGLVMTALEGGGFVVGWYSNSPSGFGNSVFGQVFDATGATLGPVLRFNETPGVLSQFPSLAAMPDGGFIATWEENQTAVPTIFMQRYAADGTAAGGNFEIAPPPGYNIGLEPAARHDAPRITVLEDGGFLVSWTLAAFPGGTEDFDVVQRRFDPQTFATAGNDLRTGGPGNDWIHGLAGNDTLSGWGGNDTLYGDAGADLLQGGQGDDLLFGGNGNDTLNGGNGADTLDGGNGNDLAFGGAGADSISGGNGADLLYGGAGDDVLSGDAGYDTLFGGEGNDTLFGGAGHDLLYGDEGNDRARGGDGHDVIFGGADNDTLFGDAGNDLLYGGTGDDLLYGGVGSDLLMGEDGDDRLYGQGGNDTLSGGRGDDQLFGGGGHDVLRGDGGNDTLDGGAGNDTLIGGGGANILTGGSGADLFVFEAQGHNNRANNRDVITDFESGVDRLDLRALHPSLSFIGSAAFSGTVGEVRLHQNGRLEADLNGNGARDWFILLEGVSALDSGDLIL